MNPVRFHINGRLTKAFVRADMTVLEWLRSNPQTCGSKEGCAEGDCGACSILLARPGSDAGDFGAVNSCIMLMGQIEGCSLITVEGLSPNESERHPVQVDMAENGSSQCGFCTPGIVMSLAGLLNKNANPNDEQIHDALAGNLCRCTGYRPIVEAAKSAADKSINQLAKLAGDTIASDDASNVIGSEDSVFFRPKTLAELCLIRSEHPGSALLAGGTDLGLGVAEAKTRWPIAIVTAGVGEMLQIDEFDDHISFGGAVTWERALPHLHRHYPSFANMVRRFGSTQVRNMGTIAGNIGNASPIGDGPPALIALGASVVLANVDGEREILLEDFCTGYRQTVLADDELISKIKLPLPKAAQQFRVYKISKRYDQDISTVCGAFSVEINDDGAIANAHVAFGGMAATSQRCPGAEAALNGNQLGMDLVAPVSSAINAHFSPLDDWRGSANYRGVVAANLFERFVRDVAGETVEVMAL